jgi:hypothetical protein
MKNLYYFILLFLSFKVSSETICQTNQICGDLFLHGITSSEEIKAENIRKGEISYVARFALFQVEEILRRKRKFFNYEIIWVASGIKDAKSTVFKGRYIIMINSNWAKIIIEKYSSSMPLTWVLAHEVGHHVFDHKPHLLGDEKTKAELEADNFAGYILGQIHAYQWDSLRWLDSARNNPVSDDYPTYPDRISSVSSGYLEGCKKDKIYPGSGCSQMLIDGNLSNPPSKQHAKGNESQNIAASTRSFVSVVQGEATQNIEEGKSQGKILKEAGDKAIKELTDRGLMSGRLMR